MRVRTVPVHVNPSPNPLIGPLK